MNIASILTLSAVPVTGYQNLTAWYGVLKPTQEQLVIGEVGANQNLEDIDREEMFKEFDESWDLYLKKSIQ